MSRQISLMFSGGVDSTFGAIMLAEEYERVHLLTYNNEYGVFGAGLAARRGEELKARFPGRFEHHLISIRPLFEEIVLKAIQMDYRRYRSGFVWCMGCKLAMHTMSAAYDLRHGIDRHTDGSSLDTSEMVEQMPVAISRVREFYSEHGIRFAPTAYEVSRDEKRERLVRDGFRMGIPVRDRYLGIQPRCVPGELYYLPFVLLGRPPRHESAVVDAYIQSKRPLMEKLLKEEVER